MQDQVGWQELWAAINTAIASSALICAGKILRTWGAWQLQIDTLWRVHQARAERAALAEGAAFRQSPPQISEEWLREKIATTGYKASPVMAEAFRVLVNDPKLPAEDWQVWRMLVEKFGADALFDEAACFGASHEYVDAIWALCIRKARCIEAEDRANIFMRRIGAID